MADLFQMDSANSTGLVSPSQTQGISFVLSVIWLFVVFFLAGAADLMPLVPYEHMDWFHPSAPPGTMGHDASRDRALSENGNEMVHIFGTDTMGRDILARLIYGARISLGVGLAAPFIGILIGGVLGMLAGFYRGRSETVITSVMDAILAFPGLVLLLAITFYLGPEIQNIVMALGFLSIPYFCRIARANTLACAKQEFVQAARMLGQSDVSILCREIFPNVAPPVFVYGLLVVSYVIVAEGALSFLGLSVPPQIPSWGAMISEGREVLDKAPHVSLIPVLILFLTVLSFNLIGDRLGKWVDSRENKL
jgi:peptide/nickel transport system permease protein